MTDPVKKAPANPFADPLSDDDDTFDGFAPGRGSLSLEGGTDIVFSSTSLPPENLIEGEIRYKTLKEVPVCEIEGGIPITDKYLTEVHQAWVVKEDDRFSWVRFFAPGEIEKLKQSKDKDDQETLKKLFKPKDDATLRRIQASKDNFKSIEQVASDVLGLGEKEPKDVQYNLCRSKKPDKDGGVNLYVYRRNQLLENTCNAVSEGRLKPLPNETLLDEEATLLVSLGRLNSIQYCISDDWTSKFYITSHLPTIDLLEKKLLASSNGISQERKKAIVADIELAIRNERETLDRARAALRLQEAQAKKSDIHLGFLVVMTITQILMIIKMFDIKLSRAKLEDFGRNLTDMAKRGELDLVIGRFEEVKLVVKRLMRDKKASAMLVGEAGAGKTAVVEKLAQLIALGDEAVALLKMEGVSEQEARALTKAIKKVFAGKPIGDVDVSNLVGGTGIRGTFETKMKRFLKVFKRAIPFMDEIHRLMGAGSTRESADSADQAIKPALGRGELKMIGATTLREYLRWIAPDAALKRRFGEPIFVHEYSAEETLSIVKQYRDRGGFKTLYGIEVSDAAIERAIHLAEKLDGTIIDQAPDIIVDAIMDKKMDPDYRGGDITAEDIDRAFKVKEKYSIGRYLEELVKKRSGPKGGGGSGEGGGPDATGGPGGDEPPPTAGTREGGARTADVDPLEPEIKILDEPESKRPNRTMLGSEPKGPSRVGGIMDGAKGFFAGIGPFIAADILEGNGVITPEEKSWGIGAWFVGLTFVEASTPVHLAAIALPFHYSSEMIRHGLSATGVKRLRYDGTVNKVSGTVGAGAVIEGAIVGLGYSQGAQTFAKAHQGGARFLNEALMHVRGARFTTDAIANFTANVRNVAATGVNALRQAPAMVAQVVQKAREVIPQVAPAVGGLGAMVAAGWTAVQAGAVAVAGSTAGAALVVGGATFAVAHYSGFGEWLGGKIADVGIAVTDKLSGVERIAMERPSAEKPKEGEPRKEDGKMVLVS